MKRTQFKIYIPSIDRHASPLFPEDGAHGHREYAKSVAIAMSKVAGGANVLFVDAGVWQDEVGVIHIQPCYIAYCNYDTLDATMHNQLASLVWKVKKELNQKWIAVERIQLDFDLVGETEANLDLGRE